MPDLGAHTPDSGGDCSGCPRDENGDPVPWPCDRAWWRLRRQYCGPVVVVEWDLLTYVASQLVWAGQRMPHGDTGDIAARVIRHLTPPVRRNPGLYGANSRWPR